MLLPALNKARERAKAISCLSNIKQIGQASLMYVNAYNDHLPPFTYLAGSKLCFGPGVLIASMELPLKVFWCPCLRSKYEVSYMENYGVEYAKEHPTSLIFKYPAYGMNSRLMQQTGDHEMGKKINTFKNTSSLACWMDTYMSSNKERGYYRVLEYYSTSTWGQVDPRHENRCNVNFVDGHAESVKAKGTGNRYTFTSAYNAYVASPFKYYTGNKFWSP
jgi:prepilin-type processing-associated H-X9-DG protein